MNKKLLLLFISLLYIVTLSAQISIIDFEDDGGGLLDCNPTAEWINDPAVPVVTVAANPETSGINATPNCVQYIETTGSNMGNSLQLAFNGSTVRTGHNLADNKFVKLMVYSADQTDFDVLLELGNGNVAHFAMTKSISTTLNTWTEIEFDFSGSDPSAIITNAGGWISNIRIHFNNGTVGQGDTYYVDEYYIAPTGSGSTGDGNVITDPTLLTVGNPIVMDYDATGGLVKEMEVSVTTTGSYANFALYANDEIIADNFDIPNAGTYSLNALVRLPQSGNVELKLAATGNNVTVENLTLSDYNGVTIPDFSNVTNSAGIVDQTSLKYGGPTIADMDNDGYYDLVLNNHNDSPSKLFMSNGDGSFVKQSPDLALWNMMDLHGSAAGDYDNDGDLDLIITLGGGNGTNPTLPVFYKNENGALVRDEAGVGITAGARGRSPRWSDMDLDGDLDIMFFNAEGVNGSNGEQHLFYENSGDGTFEIRNIAGMEDANGEKVLLTDLNNDHIDDIVVLSPLSLWKGNGDFTFTQVNSWLPSGLAGSFGVQAATDIDLDNDGDLDLYFSKGEYYFTVAEQNSADFLPDLNRLDMITSGSQGTLPFEITADGSITISGLDHSNRNGYMGGFPFFLGSALQVEGLANREEQIVITPEMAEGWSEERTENGLYIGHVGNGVWKIETVRNENIYWGIHLTFDGINGFTPTGWVPNNRNQQDILLRNDNGSFVNVSDEWNIPAGGNHWGVTRGDFNNDSYQDLYIYRAGYVKNRVSDYMLLNTGQGSFEITTGHNASNVGSRDHGDMGQAFDYNLDGNVDILNGDDQFGLWHLYDNGGASSGNYVLVQVGYGPNTNVDPIAAEVVVYTPGGNEYFSRVGSAGEAHSQSLLNTIHFGLGAETEIDSIAVRWRNGETYVMTTSLTANNLYNTDQVAPTGITVNPAATEVREGTTKQLSANIMPVNANTEVTWASSNDGAVSVDANGVVTGNIVGETAVITATTLIGGLVDSALVTVVEFFAVNVESISVSPDTLNLLEGDTESLTALILPVEADNMDVLWTSSDQTVATVDANGVVTAVAEGMTVITGTTVDGNLQDNSVVNVSSIVAAFVAYDDESIYLNTIYNTNGAIDITCNYHAGSGNTVIGGNFGGVKFWLRELNADWGDVNDYTHVDAEALGTESGTSSASIPLNAVTPTASLPSGNFYFLWVSFASSNGNTYDKGIVNINIEGTTSIEDQELENMNVHPIPARDYIYLTGLEEGLFDLKIVDLQGRVMIDRKVEDNATISVEMLPAGMYILNVEGKETARSFKVFKIN